MTNEAEASAIKPRMFIGSSSEHLPTANELGSLLEENARIIHWDGLIRAGQFTIEGLFEGANCADFALLVFAPDDILYSRDKQYWATRDNVIFELGLFMGASDGTVHFSSSPRSRGTRCCPTYSGSRTSPTEQKGRTGARA